MAFSLRSKRLSIPKGRNQVSQPRSSREVSERRAASIIWPRAVSTVPKREGSQPPSLIQSPGNCPPLAGQALAPDRSVFICAAKTAGFKIARAPGSVCAPQGRSSELEYRLAEAGKEPPTLRPPGQPELAQLSQSPTTVSEKFALLHRGKPASETREPDGS